MDPAEKFLGLAQRCIPASLTSPDPGRRGAFGGVGDRKNM
jgi:hypothetical protein